MNPLISIIVPIYNVERYLSQCLDSLVNQTFKNIEIILVDDGSQDDSPSICDKYAQEDKRIKVIHKPNGGVSSARNAGLLLMSGEYIMFVDGDDWVDLETCEKAYDVISKEKADCLMFSYVKEFENHSVINHIFEKEFLVWKKEEIRCNFHRKLFGLMKKELSRPQDGDLIVSVWMQLFSAEKYKDIQFYDIRKTGTFEDGLYQIDVYSRCEKFVYIDKPYYHYRKTNQTSVTSQFKPILFQQWQFLFDIMETKIPEEDKTTYQEALNNRICLSMIGLGFNQINSKKGLSANSQALSEMLSTQRYESALNKLEFKYMPLHWRLFFFLCKYRMTLSLVILLKVMNYMRNHSA